MTKTNKKWTETHYPCDSVFGPELTAALKIPEEDTLQLEDGRALLIQSWEPTAECGRAVRFKISGVVLLKKPEPKPEPTSSVSINVDKIPTPDTIPFTRDQLHRLCIGGPYHALKASACPPDYSPFCYYDKSSTTGRIYVIYLHTKELDRDKVEQVINDPTSDRFTLAYLRTVLRKDPATWFPEYVARVRGDVTAYRSRYNLHGFCIGGHFHGHQALRVPDDYVKHVIFNAGTKENPNREATIYLHMTLNRKKIAQELEKASVFFFTLDGLRDFGCEPSVPETQKPVGVALAPTRPGQILFIDRQTGKLTTDPNRIGIDDPYPRISVNGSLHEIRPPQPFVDYKNLSRHKLHNICIGGPLHKASVKLVGEDALPLKEVNLRLAGSLQFTYKDQVYSACRFPDGKKGELRRLWIAGELSDTFRLTPDTPQFHEWERLRNRFGLVTDRFNVDLLRLYTEHYLIDPLNENARNRAKIVNNVLNRVGKDVEFQAIQNNETCIFTYAHNKYLCTYSSAHNEYRVYIETITGWVMDNYSLCIQNRMNQYSRDDAGNPVPRKS